MENLKALLTAHEQWLTARILTYARRQSYTKYTSALLEAWRLSISGFSGAIVEAVDAYGERVVEFTPDEDYSENPIAKFGIMEAHRHRKRGVSLVMLLGLLKYYRQTYQDLIREKVEDVRLGARYGLFIVRCFDLLELAVSVEWNRQPTDTIIAELQHANRHLTNERNRYLTFFENISDPVFLISADLLIVNCNAAAAQLIEMEYIPGPLPDNRVAVPKEPSAAIAIDKKHLKTIFGKDLSRLLPWISEVLNVGVMGEEKNLRREVKAVIRGSTRHFLIILSGMLDVTGKYEGMIVVVSEITERKRLEEKNLKLASTDPLTGACNRRSFLEKAQAEFVRSRRYRRPMAVLVVDIDHFKKINDNYGHHMGDTALKAFTDICLQALRENDIFGRIGGEEFAAVLPETGEKRAFQVAERLRLGISELIVSHEGISFSLQASIGVAAIQEDDVNIEDIQKKADEAMYSAKRQGRNRVVTVSKKLQPVA